MKPSEQFKNTILGLLQTSQKTITNQDLAKHNSQAVTYYLISKMIYRNGDLHRWTEPFSDRTLIELSAKCDSIKIPENIHSLSRISEVEFLSHGGNNFIAWVAKTSLFDQMTIVKIISPDGVTQIKVISKDQKEQIIYNVCELPTHLINQL